jgi:hypothetical protein
MKKLLNFFLISIVLISCGSNENEPIHLQFNPEVGKSLHIKYDFEVNSVSSQAITHFSMVLNGKVLSNEKSQVTVELKNDSVSLVGNIQGKEIKANAHQTDSIDSDAKLLASSVFTYLNKVYRSVYTNQFDKKYDLQMDGEIIVDSSENRVQFFIRYPANSIKIGDSWNAELLIKSGNKMNCSATYTLVSVKNEIANIIVSGKLYGSGDSFGNAFTIDGKLDGSFSVDIKSGIPLSTDINEEFTLKLGENIMPMKYAIHSTVE